MYQCIMAKTVLQPNQCHSEVFYGEVCVYIKQIHVHCIQLRLVQPFKMMAQLNLLQDHYAISGLFVHVPRFL